MADNPMDTVRDLRDTGPEGADVEEGAAGEAIEAEAAPGIAGPKVEKRPTVASVGIKALSREGIAEALAAMGEPAFRASQIVQWLYGKGAQSYDEMTNLSKALRSRLASELPIHKPKTIAKQVSRDGTRKYLIEFCDGVSVEAVGIPSRERLTVCFSTQAGCPIRCAFCATGRTGLTRNLAPGEMVDQIRIVAEDFGRRPTNVVAMGQGEPFLNYDNTLAALRFMNAKDGLGIGARHITVSTCGILPQIRRFAAEPEQFNLAVSLHSAIQETRNALMPGVRQYSLERLQDSLASYAQTAGRRVTLEYALVDQCNDTDAEFRALLKFCRRFPCHVNLIPMNIVKGSRLAPSPQERILYFQTALNDAGIECTIRNSKGADIDGACGQLKQRMP